MEVKGWRKVSIWVLKARASGDRLAVSSDWDMVDGCYSFVSFSFGEKSLGLVVFQKRNAWQG